MSNAQISPSNVDLNVIDHARLYQMKNKGPKDIDEYIAGFPPDVGKILERIRMTIRKAAPDAEEAISYQIPTFRLHGNLIHFAAYHRHI